MKYETALKSAQFLLIAHGSPAEATKAQQILRTTPVADLGVHVDEPRAVDGKGVTRGLTTRQVPGAAGSARDRPASVGHVVGDGATPGVPPGSWRMGAPKGADGRAVPQIGPHVEAYGGHEFKEEDVGPEGTHS